MTNKLQQALKQAKEELRIFSQDLLDDDYADAEGIELFNALYTLVDALEKTPLTYHNQQETPISSIVEPTSNKEEIYAIYCDNNGTDDEYGPIILETYIKHSDLETAKRRMKEIEKQGRMGKCSLARIEIIDNPKS